MRILWLLGLSVLATACSGAVTATLDPGGKPAATTTSVPVSRQACSDVEVTPKGISCIGPLEQKDFDTRAESFLLTVTGDRVTAYEQMSSGRKAAGRASEPVRFELVYQGDQLAEIRQITGSGRLHARQLTSPDGTRISLVDAEGRPSTRLSYNVIDRKLDEAGREVELAYFDDAGAPRHDGEGIHRYEIKRDARGFVGEVSGFAEDGSRAAGADGAHRRLIARDAEGRQLVVKRFDTALAPLDAAWWGAIREHGYDERGNPTFEKQLDSTGKTLWQKVFVHDERGQLKEIRCQDAAGAPMLGPEGYAALRLSFDPEGRLLERRMFGTDDKLSAPITLFLYDGRGRVVEQRSLDEQKKPAQGIFSERIRYDERDNETERAFFDAQGERTASGVGFAAYRIQYDERDRPIELRYLDTELRTQPNPLGVSLFRTSYDKDELLGEITALSATGAPIEVLRFDDVAIAPAESARSPRFRQRSKEQARARAEQALAKLKAGARFEEVAAIFDDRGLLERRRRELRTVVKDHLRDPLKSALLATPIGQPTEVLEMAGTFFVAVRQQ